MTFAARPRPELGRPSIEDKRAARRQAPSRKYLAGIALRRRACSQLPVPRYRSQPSTPGSQPQSKDCRCGWWYPDTPKSSPARLTARNSPFLLQPYSLDCRLLAVPSHPPSPHSVTGHNSPSHMTQLFAMPIPLPAPIEMLVSIWKWRDLLRVAAPRRNCRQPIGDLNESQPCPRDPTRCHQRG